MRCNLTMKKLSLSLSLSLSDFVESKQHKLLLVLSLALTLVSASFLFVLSPLQTAQATQGHYLYSWGAGGQLGRPLTPVPSNVPGRIPGGPVWVSAASGQPGNFAINTSGELFAWGAGGNAVQMGQAGNPPTTGNLTTPTRIGTANNWVQVSVTDRNVAALNSDGEIYVWGTWDPAIGESFNSNIPTRLQGTPDNWVYIATGMHMNYAIDADGFLYSWGANWVGIGRPDEGVSPTVPARVSVPNRPDVRWRTLSGTGHHWIGISQGGELFTWGQDMMLGGRPSLWATPGQVGSANNWEQAAITHVAAFARNSNGEIFSWTSYGAGYGPITTGRPVGAAHPDGTPRSQPGRLVDVNNVPISNWTHLSGGARSVIAFNEDGELWSWGQNNAGQLGLGDNTSRDRPTLVREVERFYDFSRCGLGIAPLMLVSPQRLSITDAFNLYKHLQKPEGTPAPNLNFRFTFERYSFNDESTPADIARIPVINPVIINPTTVVSPPPPPAGTVTLSGYADILDGIVFGEVGIFSWIIREDTTHPSGAGPDSTVVFSQAEYELRVYVFREPEPSGELYVRYITLHRIQNADGTIPQDGREKVNNLIFVNLYTYDPLIIPTGLFLRSGSLYLVVFAAGVVLTTYLSLRARKRIEELPIMQ